MILFPNAKINLGLHVVEKRPDGFHNIETVFYPVSMCDALEILPAPEKGIEFTTTGLAIPGDPEENLVVKAAKLMPDAGSRSDASPAVTRTTDIGSRIDFPGLRIHLHKVIPTGSGLGGGSSDAACTLKLLNQIFEFQLSDDQLETMASELGSDCAFFIRNRPVLATGRGDRFESVDLDLTGYRIEVVVPPVHVSTPEAYAMITPRKPVHALKEIIRLPVEQWKGRLTNDFEEPVMNRYPVIREARDQLYAQGAIYAAMSGSGAAVFGLFRGNV